MISLHQWQEVNNPKRAFLIDKARELLSSATDTQLDQIVRLLNPETIGDPNYIAKNGFKDSAPMSATIDRRTT